MVIQSPEENPVVAVSEMGALLAVRLPESVVFASSTESSLDAYSRP